MPQPGKFSMYPELDGSVQDALQDTSLDFTFHRRDSPRASIKEFDTKVPGKFYCANSACRNTGWSSGKIAMTIRLYRGDQYNARVYHQRCLSCNWVSRPELDNSYAERIMRRLKVWSGYCVTPVRYERKETKPHEEDHCEGCKAGRCTG